MAEAGKVPLSLGLTGEEATEWPLQRYARCIPSNTRDPPGPRQEAGTAPCPTWKVFDSNEESGYLVLTIVISGHFFIFQGQTLLGGPRMKVERNSCMEMKGRRKPKEGFSLVGSKDWLKIVRRMDCLLFGTTIKSHQHSEQQVRVTAGTGAPDGRTSLTQLAQTLLASEELPRVYEQSAWGAEELGPFLRLCLMDQNFPAFVEEVEKELKKLAGLRN
ncbi:meiotic recombination protein REC114 isoform X3 [Papio anubis]|uniref:meiotic recombination protein REC114 isoform X3 n=1 Tax=Papio anubis TaxID=9555 RepID=UPI0012AE866E|nr:meiotic recombination protein REC114 isoform X3 [Papio anubis]